MCFGGSKNTTTYKDAEPLGPKNGPDGGFTQRNNELYRKQMAAEQDPSAVKAGLGGAGKRKGRSMGNDASVVMG